ncbi:uncharacterized protein J4E88_009198 [Alternaria novae-zelandiae]|uniref:uncharacterized protein n=1 Tax=Alternaria novae-zelandiae TaxID=430562 RepID=UPI0020C3B590|nr:uncharacterized protein J4E88_009198 [Alternaria novae-zelandiae]KAI4671165.1 hypothetical protein J4E88_009198 [Alternaria novae-zelandiae]
MVDEQNAGQNDADDSISSKSYMEPASKEQASLLKKARHFTKDCLIDYKDILVDLKNFDEVIEGATLPTENMRAQRYVLRRWAKHAGLHGERKEPLKYDFCLVDAKNQGAIIHTLDDLRVHICGLESVIREKQRSFVSQRVQQIEGLIDNLEQLVKPHPTSRTIKTIYRLCIIAYAQLLRTIKKAEKDNEENISREAIMEKYDDLTEWAEQTKLIRDDNASLDCQVQNDPELHSQFNRKLYEIEDTLLLMEKFISGDYAPDSDDSDMETANSKYQKLMKEFEASLEVLAERNRSLWSLWESMAAMELGDPGLDEEHLDKLPDSDENETSDENDSIKTLAQSCVRDYVTVYEEFKAASDGLFSAWMMLHNKTRSDGNITTLQSATLDAKKVYMEKNASPGSVLQQLKVFTDWANRNGVFENGEDSLAHRLRKPTPNLKDPLPSQRILSEQGDIIMKQFRNTRTTLGLMSEILIGKRKADEDLTDSGSDSEEDVYDTGMEPTPELRRHVDNLIYYNEKLLHMTETLGGPGPSVENSYKVIESDGDVVEPEHSYTGNRGTGKASHYKLVVR